MPVLIGDKPPNKPSWKQWGIAGGVLAGVLVLLAVGAVLEDSEEQQQEADRAKLDEAIATIRPHYEQKYDGVVYPQLMEIKRGRGEVVISLQASPAYTRQLNESPQQFQDAQALAACDPALLARIAPVGIEIWLMDGAGKLIVSADCE